MNSERDQLRTSIASDGPVCWLHYVPTLREAGYPPDVWESTTDELDYVMDRYNSRYTPPRNSALKGELTRVLRASKLLLVELDKLSQRARLAVLDAKLTALPGVIADPLELKASIKELIVRTTVSAARVPKDRRGVTSGAHFLNLLLNLGILWRCQFPRGKGITKSKDDYRGPLRDFVLGILRGTALRSGNEINRTDEAIAKNLFKIRSRIDTESSRSVHTAVVVHGPRRITTRTARR